MDHFDRKSAEPPRLDGLDLALNAADIRVETKRQRLASLIVAFVLAIPAIMVSRA